jgi:predicted phage replisome organizer
MTRRKDDDMGEVQWIKLYIDMFDKRKINKIRRLPDGDRILLFWVMLLATAGKCNAGGMIFITERVPFTEEDLADEFDFEASTIKLALQAFVELDMISIDDEGFIAVSNWEKYQNTEKLAEIREYNRLAQQRSRAKRKQLQAVNDNVNDMSMTSQPCQDIEEEGEKDKEKESHSFIQACEGDAPVENSTDRESMKLKYIGGTLGKGVVMLSDEQIDDLLDRLSIEEFNKYVGIVADCELNGKPYKKKSHYQAILDMVKADRRVKA